MKAHLKPLARSMLQARVDGKLSTQEQGFALILKHQPKGGWPAGDLASIAGFAAELKTADNIPGCKVVAEKYGLEIVY